MLDTLPPKRRDNAMLNVEVERDAMVTAYNNVSDLLQKERERTAQLESAILRIVYGLDSPMEIAKGVIGGLSK